MGFRGKGTMRGQFKEKLQSRDGLPLQEQMLVYSRNLLGNHTLTDTFLCVLFESLPEAQLARLCEVVTPAHARLEHKGEDRKPEDRNRDWGCDIEELDNFVHMKVFPEGTTGEAPPDEAPFVEPTKVAMNLSELMNRSHADFRPDKVEHVLKAAVEDALAAACIHGSLEHCPELAEIRDTFDLTGEEADLLAFFFCYQSFRPFEAFCDLHPAREFVELIANCTGIRNRKVRALLSSTGRLIDIGLLMRGHGLMSASIEIDETVQDHLSGVSDCKLTERFCRPDDSEVFALDSFPVGQSQQFLVERLLGTPGATQLLFYGTQGTGKTEFARAIGKKAGLRVYFVQTGERGAAADRKLAVHAAAGAVGGPKTLLIVDEADALLNTEQFFIEGRVDKGWLNDFIDTRSCNIVWISNSIDRIPLSLRRRFDYSLEFQSFSSSERKKTWEMALASSPLKELLDPDWLSSLASRFGLNAAGIVGTVRTAEKLLDPERADGKEIQRLMEEHA